MHRIVVFFIFLFIHVVAKTQNNYWQQQVNHQITVSLNEAEKTLDGFEKIEYFNNSPDTLFFIWFHLWPNAYKNDRTAFSEQCLENGSTQFYFNDSEKRGYINRLSFKVNGLVARMEDHPEHQDIIKLDLPNPLPPGKHCLIETPFHLKLPENISRGGYAGQSIQATQWYPKPAVYDKKGWHAMPYLDQGEFYSEFGNYEVKISLPANYIVAATGKIIDQKEENIDSKNLAGTALPFKKKRKPFLFEKKVVKEEILPLARNIKTVIYKQDNVLDFAWFADKRFNMMNDTLQLKSGRIIQVNAYKVTTKEDKQYWNSAIEFIKKTVIYRGNALGEYPYDVVTVVEGSLPYAGGMEYPTITLLSGAKNKRDLEGLIEHEVGHNWNYGILASNERDHPWMDEGMNTYYGNRYWKGEENINDNERFSSKFINKRIPGNMDAFFLQKAISTKNDQPIETVSEKFSYENYNIIAYHKASRWMNLLENKLGMNVFDSSMHQFFQRWKFKHPYPEDFKNMLEETGKQNLDAEFALLSAKGSLTTNNNKKKWKLQSFFSFKDTEKYKYIFAAPAVGYNFYDKLMMGATIHNYTIPAQPFQFIVTPMYATGSNQLRGVGRAAYHWYPSSKQVHKIEIGLSGSLFFSRQSMDTSGKKIFESFYKIVPFFKLYFTSKDRSSLQSWIDFRCFAIGEKQFDNYNFIIGSDSSKIYPKSFTNGTRYINQLSFNIDNNRVLYPYDAQLQIQQGDGFYRVNITGNYFFNYAKGGGLKARFFAAKFGTIGNSNSYVYQYQPKLLAGNGEDDYTYNNYFMSRTAAPIYNNPLVGNNDIGAQQVMVQNGGGLKLRLDGYDYLHGRSESWVAAVNISSTLPKNIFPFKLPLKVFFDAGTYAEAWKKNPPTAKFLYTGGLQVSLFKEVLNIYLPLIYSKDFKNTLVTDAEANKFLKKITFSIDLQNLTSRKLFPQFSF